MSTSRAELFADSLRQFETDGKLDPFIALFSDDARISNTASSKIFEGTEGVRRFWREYRNTLEHVTSEFRSLIDSGEHCALEWITQGTASNGAAISYEGVSILEWRDDKVVRFNAYFDPHALGLELAENAGQRRSEVPATAPA